MMPAMRSLVTFNFWNVLQSKWNIPLRQGVSRAAVDTNKRDEYKGR